MVGSDVVPVLAEETLRWRRLRSVYPTRGVRKLEQLCKAWMKVLDLCGAWATGPVDWGNARTLFWGSIPKELMYDPEFQAAVAEVLSVIYGPGQAEEGTRRIFAIFPG